jgi:hypothetical protein
VHLDSSNLEADTGKYVFAEMAFQLHRLPALLKDSLNSRGKEMIESMILKAKQSGKLPPEIVSTVELTLFDLGSETLDLEIEQVLQMDPFDDTQPLGMHSVVFLFRYGGSISAEFKCDVQVNPISSRHALFQTTFAQRPIVVPLYLRIERVRLGGKVIVSQRNCDKNKLTLCFKSNIFHDVVIRSNFERHFMAAHENIRRLLVTMVHETAKRIVDEDIVINLPSNSAQPEPIAAAVPAASFTGPGVPPPS